MKKSLVIIDSANYRCQMPISSAIKWASLRNIPTKRVPEHDLSSCDWDSVAMVYFPLPQPLRFASITSILHSIPVVFDFQSEAFIEKLSIFDTHKIALRRAFGGPIRVTPSYQVPYIVPPNVCMQSTKRDVVVFDIHHWLPLTTQFEFVALLNAFDSLYMEVCSTVGSEVKFYFSGLNTANTYLLSQRALVAGILKRQRHCKLPFGENMSRILGPNYALSVVRDHSLPPATSPSEYSKILSSALLFITDNGDLADQDNMKCVVEGTPILILGRCPLVKSGTITHSLAPALSHMDSSFDEFFNLARQMAVSPGADLADLIRPSGFAPLGDSVPNLLSEKAWDSLYDWATEGKSDKDLLQIIADSEKPEHHVFTRNFL